MKLRPVFIAFLILRYTPLFSQNYQGDTTPVHILIPDTEYPVIDGRKSGPSVSGYAVNPNMQLPSPADTISGKTVFIERKRNELKSEKSVSAENYFYRFLENTSAKTGIINQSNNFRITDVHSDDLGITHIRSVQLHNGIEVYGSESVYHIDAEKERFTGSFHNLSEGLETQPRVSKEDAIELVVNDLKKENRYRELTEEEAGFLDYAGPDASLTYYRGEINTDYRLTWEILIRPNFIEEWKYFIDAIHGTVLLKYNNTKSDGSFIGTGFDLNNILRTFNVYQTSGIYYLYDVSQKMFNPSKNEGIIITLDGNGTTPFNLDYSYITSADNTWSHKAAISAHCNATKTYHYFDTTFGRNSINDKGGNIVSIVNVTADDGTPLENAFWNGQVVFYGNGGTQFKPVAGALDITAHELSHGVISSTANLEYYGQPGAINEAFADIFACMVDRDDWTIGEDITLENYSPSGVIRDLSNPHNKGTRSDRYWQPTHTSEMYLGTEDNAGIHLNSGIINHAFYIFATRVGKSKAERVFYRALTEYLTKSADFIALRIAVVQSVRDLYGDSSNELYEAAWAFESVGIYEEEFVSKTPEYEANPGEQMLLTYDTNPGDPVSLYMSSPRGTNYRPITRTLMNGKISVTDDGSTAVFVSSERRIRMINTGSSDVNEVIISGMNYYDQVAISKDGKRIAATKGFFDGSIYFIDLVSGEGRQFILYNPTTNPNMVVAGVLKAYSLEFDITGEYVIYDAYNVINSSSAKDIYYRDIGIIKVWDNKTQSFGDGTISKLYSSLPANVNIANPVFAKNSPHIIAFDYFYDDGIIENYSIYIANVETGKTSQIAVNDRLGYPSFSTNDDRIAFSSINSSDMQVVKSVKLAADKMTPVGEAGVLVPHAKWPVYFTRGIRSLGLAPVSDFTADYKYGNYPVTSRFIDRSANSPVAWHWIFENGNPPESFEQYPVTTFETPGFYTVTLITSNEFGSDTLTRERYIHAINPTAIDEPEQTKALIYPNPAMGDLHISVTGEFSVRIFNMQGETVHSSRNKDLIDLTHMPPGIYFVELRTGSSTLKQKIVKH